MTSSTRSQLGWEAHSPPLLSEVRFGSFLTYSPRGASDLSQQSRAICHRIKVDGVIGDPPVRVIEYAIARLQQELVGTGLGDFVAPDVTLVPCPRSAPFPPGQKTTLWVALRICEALKDAGFGGAILPCLERIEAVEKSAFAAPGGRPSAQRHLDTMRVTRELEPPSGRITLVDDVITKGATLLAAASLLAATFPRAEIKAFALIRTMGLIPEVERIVDPVVGRVARTPSGAADRQP